jgi:Family of unknown function (DUF6481)
MAYREPSFQDRIGLAADAKKRALERLKAKPKLSEAELAARREAQEAKDRAAAERRAEAKAAAEEAKRLKAEAAAAAAAAAAPPPPPPPPKLQTEAERKAARDARYAARKMRK